MSSCCLDGQFCDFPWCDCDGNAEWRRKHKLEKPSDKEQDCGEQSCNYCRQMMRPAGVKAPATVDELMRLIEEWTADVNHGVNDLTIPAAIRECAERLAYGG